LQTGEATAAFATLVADQAVQAGAEDAGSAAGRVTLAQTASASSTESNQKASQEGKQQQTADSSASGL